MAKEIERKFLVRPDTDLDAITERRSEMIQAYLSTDPRATVRVRITDTHARLTVKGRNKGIERNEWEYDIPVDDARQMIDDCADPSSVIISKTRRFSGRWEIDEFHGPLQGLVTAEIEMSDPEENIEIPQWIEREVSGDVRYYNSILSRDGMPS